MTVFATDRWIVDTPFDLRKASTWPAIPSEYGSWKSNTTTFFACSLSIMKRASVGPWMASSGTTRKKPGVASFGLPSTDFVSDVRVADGETCASPASK